MPPDVSTACAHETPGPRDDLPSAASIRVAVLASYPVVAAGVAGELARSRGLTVVGSATTVPDLDRLSRRSEFDVVVIRSDRRDWVPQNYRELSRASEALAHVKHIIWVVPPALLRSADRFAPAGCGLLLSTDKDLQVLTTAVIDIVSNDRRRTSGPQPAASPSNISTRMTERERQALECMIEGLAIREIAGRLRISVNTARTHSQRVLRKLDAHSRTEAVTIALESGLVEPLQSLETFIASA